MNEHGGITVERWTRVSIATSGVLVAVLALLALVPVVLSANATDKLTTLFIYVILAAMWNALAGYAASSPSASRRSSASAPISRSSS